MPPAAGAQKASSDDVLRKQEALTYLRELKERLKNKKDTYDEFLEIMKEFKAQRIDTDGVIKRVKTIFKGHKDLILGFNQFLPKGHEIRVEDVEREEREEAERAKAAAGGAAPKPQVEFVHAISYVNKIKTRFANDERVYKAFLEILNMYRKNLKSISQVYEEVATLFKTHNDLLEEFTYFLPDFSTPGAGKKGAKARGKGALPPGGANKRKGKNDKLEPPLPPAEQERKTAESLSKELAFFEKVKARLKNRDAYNELIKCINIFNSEVISKMELQALVYDIIGKHPDLHSGFSDFLAQCELMDFDFGDGKAKDGKLTQREAQKQKMMSAREKFLSKPISELDLSACERCGPSYRLLPKNFPKATASARTPLCIEHLNDNWVSVTSGSEDYSFKAMRKNQYEEALFRCEDDRFELDMVLETTRATIEVIEPVVEKVSKMTPEEATSYRLPEGHLTSIHLRSIERLYGIGTDQGTDIRRMIQDYPAATAPLVLGRLKQKEAEWKKVKTEVTPIWVDVYEKNYNKSLDHRSFYFKQTDKKALSAKGMTSEIKEVSDKKKTSEEAIGCGSVGALGPHGISPDLTFTYADRKVHDDVFAVLKFSTQEMMNAEQAERVMKSWREFVEPFFGISRADPEGDYVDDSAEQAAVFVRKDEEDEEENDEGEHDGEGSDKPASGDDAADAEMEDADENKARKEKDSEEEEDDEAPGKKRKATAAGKGAKGKKAKKEESEEEEEAESDEDDEEEKLYAACKPLSGAVVSSDEETVAATPLEKLDGRVFYGHDGYYMLFRLHQHLYERLSTARASAASMSQQFGQKAQPEAVRAAKEREIHNDFLRLLFKLLNGTVESSNFEDDCRTLLGANSYVLFTLDKLIYKIVKQIQSLLADENATKLLHLLEYEKQRKSPFVEAIYHANASVLLLDESCYRFGSEDGGASLTLQLMDSGLDKADLPAGTMEAQFHDYLESFLRTSADEEDEEDGGKPWMADRDERPDVYLHRSKTAAGLDRGPDAMGKTSVYNSLECKISCSNSKVSYVLDTEDVFHRRVGTGAGKGRGRGVAGVAAAAAKAERASAKFNAWLEEKQATMPKEDEAAEATEAEAVPDFATAAAAAALADVETHEEELAEEDAEVADDGDAEAEEEGEADDDDKAVEAEAPADEEMEDAEGDEQDQ